VYNTQDKFELPVNSN